MIVHIISGLRFFQYQKTTFCFQIYNFHLLFRPFLVSVIQGTFIIVDSSVEFVLAKFFKVEKLMNSK